MFNDLEKKRIERAVGEFVAKRRPPPHLRDQVDLGFKIEKQSVEIFEMRPVWRGNGEWHDIPVAKATFVRTRGVWRIFWQRQDLKWHGYESLPEVRSIEEFVAEVDADPWACFWG